MFTVELELPPPVEVSFSLSALFWTWSSCLTLNQSVTTENSSTKTWRPDCNLYTLDHYDILYSNVDIVVKDYFLNIYSTIQ